MANILIAYYSRKGQNYWNGSIKNLAKGNTEIVAEMIQKAVGGDLFEIETVKEYPADYTECTEAAKEELRAKARPELKSYPERIDNYDIIFLGYPCWWGTMPMGVYTFLEHFDFAGKKIVPFCTHEGSRMGGSENHIKKTAPGAVVLEGLPVHGAEAAESEDAVTAWAKKSLSAEAGGAGFLKRRIKNTGFAN
ncbi:MAG: NAD(P)H-dependent oxidoreductase [Acidaminococcaceae bacterium]|nr:NAD(P)H-dependent oxidoreductase [Acidaminococcaceae bacterium]